MLGHLKAEEFIDAIEGSGLSEGGRAHLESCAVCAERLRSARAMQLAVMDDSDVPEPDWNEFRGSVRTELLSRAIQRESAVRRWTGWPIRPAMAWTICFLLLVCLSAGTWYWHLSNEAAVAKTVVEETIDNSDDPMVWATSTSFFDELSTLEEPQVERLRLLLESAPKSVLARQ